MKTKYHEDDGLRGQQPLSARIASIILHEEQTAVYDTCILLAVMLNANRLSSPCPPLRLERPRGGRRPYTAPVSCSAEERGLLPCMESPGVSRSVGVVPPDDSK